MNIGLVKEAKLNNYVSKTCKISMNHAMRFTWERGRERKQKWKYKTIFCIHRTTSLPSICHCWKNNNTLREFFCGEIVVVLLHSFLFSLTLYLARSSFHSASPFIYHVERNSLIIDLIEMCFKAQTMLKCQSHCDWLGFMSCVCVCLFFRVHWQNEKLSRYEVNQEINKAIIRR